MSSFKFETFKRDDRVDVIVGMGPAGLSHALVNIMYNKYDRKMILLTDRPTVNEDTDSPMHTRNATFRLDLDIIAYLEELVGKETIAEYFEKKLIGPKETLGKFEYHSIQIKTLETLLYESLLAQQSERLEIIHLPKRSQSKIESIDPCSQTIHLSIVQDNQSIQKRAIHFKYLIGADGPSHSVSNLIPNSGIEYHETQHPQIHDKHARVTYRLPDDSCSDDFRCIIKEGMQAKKNKMLQFKQMGWTLYSEPEIRIFTVDGGLFVVAECPDSISANDENNIDRWIKTILEQVCPEDRIESLQKIDTAVFNSSLKEANTTLIPFTPNELYSDDKDQIHEQSSYFLQVGDALRTVPYLTGSGAVVALREAKAYDKFIKSNQLYSDLECYHSEIAEIRFENRLRADTFLDARADREKKATPRNLGIDTVHNFFNSSNSDSRNSNQSTCANENANKI